MKEIKIFDNHKIPRKFRKGFRFWIQSFAGFHPECDGAGWKSKYVYLHIKAAKDKPKVMRFGYDLKYKDIRLREDEFKIKKNLCSLKRGRTE